MNVKEALDWLSFCAENDCDDCTNNEKPIEWCSEKMAECVQRVKIALDTPNDVRKVVLCKDCRQRRVEGKHTHYYYCDFMGSMCGDNEYCSFGERREP